ncbi:acetyltransferase (GNAT) domain-containing protein [Hirsutella rhossiliensis]|uniref:Acetyltransferase (GNAT) domain-containing protein n=1 Tax=Hirsutella rhossiliensis TaxID=111463 RepID=A0A9P8SI63_9HYPO|nr:acetyltransferase (GNAT) domain-containing protein [Hirsutella rhossiliensis]KAH0962869.1 acetyltransferase (GNAT) domain-containing protein [Hirsutella rhossiliensis]
MATNSTCASPEVSLSSLSPDETILRLPHPYQTDYNLHRATTPGPPPRKELADIPLYRIREKVGSAKAPTPCKLDNARLLFSEPTHLKSSELPPAANNSAWARARRSPCSFVVWDGPEALPSPAQAWLLLYVFFTLRPGNESIRLELRGPGAATLAQQLIDLLLATSQAPPSGTAESQTSHSGLDEALVVARQGTFWQGAGSPFGPRPVWLPEGTPRSLRSSSGPSPSYPIAPLHHTITVASAGDPQDPHRYQQSYHPIRPAKPAPGALIYSRWIPHIKETFSMVVLDWENEEHLGLLHGWMNDPRVSQGWHEEGTLEHHRQYLRTIHDDPHQMAVLARWDDTFFGYFEFYWAKEDRLGGYYDAGDFDRGRHALVGDVRFRGPHRVSGWWSSQIHYLFLDDPRTMYVVGQPKISDPTSSLYDLIHGFRIDRFIDLPHKRSTVNGCPRGKFFQLCPMAEQEKAVGGLQLVLGPKL